MLRYREVPDQAFPANIGSPAATGRHLRPPDCVQERQTTQNIFVCHSLHSPTRYFVHFQPTLCSPHLSTRLKDPWNLVTFIAFFPPPEDVTIEILDTYNLPPLPNGELEGTEPATVSPFRGSLRYGRPAKRILVLELVKSRVQYHTLSFRETTVWTGVQELIVACGPTLRVLDFSTHSVSGFRSSLPRSKRNT